MASLSVNGIVRITRDSEERKVSSGTWHTFGIAAFRKNAKDGKQSADFFDAEIYLKSEQASLARYLKKGNLIFIENAFLRNDQFTGQDGQQKNKFKILIMAFDILNEGVAMNEPKAQPVPQSAPKSVHPSDLGVPLNVPVPKAKTQPQPEENNFPAEDEEEIPF
jgi:single-stranded DNA-binding protein